MMLAFRLNMGRYRVSCSPGSHTVNPAERRAWGCDEVASAPVFPDPRTGDFFASKQFDTYRCPACQVGHEWLELVATWSVFGGRDHVGPMPIAGGWLDQMQWFADANTILMGERQRYLEARRKEEVVRRGR